MDANAYETRTYLGLPVTRPKVAFFELSSCEGCQLQLVNNEATQTLTLRLLDGSMHSFDPGGRSYSKTDFSVYDLSLDLDTALAKTFAPDKLNYLMLMMVDPDVHFHVLPRYAAARAFAGSHTCASRSATACEYASPSRASLT